VKIVVAMDSFKGSLSAREACAAVGRALEGAVESVEVVECPLADGGEGTAEILMEAFGGRRIECMVTGPLAGRRVRGFFAWCPAKKTAVVEMAAASGLTLLSPEERNPLRTTTFGTGELVRAAAAQGAERILMGVGGSATVDGGMGAASALGWLFRDDGGREVGRLGGGQLMRLETVAKEDEIPLPDIDVLCDVDNPLCGPRGAARVYAPQKGATPEMVEILERGLERLAAIVEEDLGVAIADLPGGGAAGGLAAGAVAFMGARLRRGIEAVLDAVEFSKKLAGASMVITGEGRVDEQSFSGKVVSGVIDAARSKGVPVLVVGGTVALPEGLHFPEGVEVISALPAGMSVPQGMQRAGENLREAVRDFFSGQRRVL